MSDTNMQAIAAILVLSIFYLLAGIRKRALFLQTLRWTGTLQKAAGFSPEKRAGQTPLKAR